MCEHIWVVTMCRTDNRCIAQCVKCKRKDYRATGIDLNGDRTYGK